MIDQVGEGIPAKKCSTRLVMNVGKTVRSRSNQLEINQYSAVTAMNDNREADLIDMTDGIPEDVTQEDEIRETSECIVPHVMNVGQSVKYHLNLQETNRCFVTIVLKGMKKEMEEIGEEIINNYKIRLIR
jgi:hypothetical protein